MRRIHGRGVIEDSNENKVEGRARDKEIKKEPGSASFPQRCSDAWQAQQILNALVHVLLPALLLPLLILVLLPAVVLLVHLLGGVAALAAALVVVQLVGVLVVELVEGLGHEQGGGVRLLQLWQKVVQV